MNTKIFLKSFLAVLLLLITGNFLSVSKAEAWYNASWSYRVKITVDYTKVPSNQTNFPVYVNLANLPAGFHTHVNQTDARDIRVTRADGDTELPREVVYYTAASDTGELYFKANSLSNSANTDFYIYYGNAAATEPAANSTYGSQNVWDSNYLFVHHYGNGSTLSLTDSTAYANNGSNSGTTAAVGKIGGAVEMSGVNQIYTIADKAQFKSLTALSIEVWGYLDASDTTGYFFLTKNVNDVTPADPYEDFAFFGDATLNTMFRLSSSPTTGWTDNTQAAGYMPITTWTGLVATYDGSTMRTYKNGSVSATTTSISRTTGVNTNPLRVGDFGPAGYAYDYNGKMDEMRMSNIARSGTWLSTQYNNQNSPSTFYAVGSEESPAAPTVSGSDETNVDSMTTTLNGTVSPNGATTTSFYLWGTSNAACSSLPNATSAQTISSGASSTALNVTIPGLIPGVTYYYCAVGINSLGPTFSTVSSFVQTSASGCPAVPLNSDYTVPASCVFGNGTADGVDKGSGTINSGVLAVAKGTTLTVGAGQTVAYGVIYRPGATIVRLSGGSIRRSSIWVPDTDGDGYPDNPGIQGQIVQDTQPAGYTRRAVIGGANVDCSTNDNTKFKNYIAYTDADGDGYTTTVAPSLICGGSSLTAGLSLTSSEIDCNDANASYGATCPSIVTTTAASSITVNSAILNSTVNPNNYSTDVTYRYGTSNVACASLPSTLAGPTGLTGTNNLSGATTRATLSGLTPPNTTYYFCASATSSQGTTYGTVLSFATLADVPSVTTSAATSITSSQGVLNSTINPNGASTNVTYAYGTSNVACGSLPSTLAGPVGLTGTSNLSGASTQATLSSLNPNTTYYFCAYATNSQGTTYGSVLNFTTSAIAPSITAQSSSSLAITSATLNSTVNPNNATTSITYRYSTSNNVCSSLASTLAGPTGLTGLNAISPNATSLTGLTGNTTYYYCSTANNVAGT
ncbi:MAG: hypothetical protein COX79_00735, partial [Candidatus Levybacteria bacterium CG_4_10_14_0_2_um_filter_36_16]